MKIAIFVHSFLPDIGGVQVFSFNLAKALLKKGHEVEIYTSRRTGCSSREIIEGITVNRFRVTRSILASPNVTLGLIPKRINSDIVHAFWWYSFQAFVAALKNSFGGPPLILNSNYHPTRHSVTARILGITTLKRANKIIALSPMEEMYLARFVDKKKLVRIPYGIDITRFQKPPNPSKFRARYGYNSEDKIILYVGSLTRYKGVDTLIKAMPLVLREIPKAKLVIIGKGDPNELKKVAYTLKARESVEFIGVVDEAELLSAYAACDVFALCSEHESFGMSLLEASAIGKPLISTKVGIAPELIVNGFNGFLFNGDANHLASGLLRILNNEQFKKNAQRRRQLILKEFSWNTIVSKIEKLYETTINGFK